MDLQLFQRINEPGELPSWWSIHLSDCNRIRLGYECSWRCSQLFLQVWEDDHTISYEVPRIPYDLSMRMFALQIIW